VRLGLVFEGGVSLAVWMSGVAQEIDLLRRAGAPGRGVLPDGAGPALRRWRELCDRLDVDVIVDVVSGTSAGGVNGALLAAAAATGNPLPPLKELWVDTAQLQRGKLLRAPGRGPVPSLLDGRYFAERLRAVFDEALAPPAGRTGPLTPPPLTPRPPTPSPLAPSPLGADAGLASREAAGLARPAAYPVTLLTTATALGDAEAFWEDSLRGRFGVADHRRVYRFRHDPHAVRFRPPVAGVPADPFELFEAVSTSQIGGGNAAVLARAARATAGFPGAFEPVDEHDAEADLRPYRISGGGDGATLIDGGVLDATPFEPLLGEIAARPVDGDWRRVIGYVTAADGVNGRAAGAATAVRGWLPALASTLRMSSETSFRIGVQALARHAVDVQRRVAGPERLLTQALAEPERMAATAASMYELYRQHRVDSGVLDACLAATDGDAVRALWLPRLDNAKPGEAPLWVPPESYADATAEGAHARWRWGATAAERTVRLLIHHLRDEARRRPVLLAPALAELSRSLTAVIAVRDFIAAGVVGAEPTTCALLQAVNEMTARAHGPEVLGALVTHAAGVYAEAVPGGGPLPHDVLNAALAVEVVTNAVAGRQPFSREARFDVVRMGPDVDAPVVSRGSLGAWKLYGLRLGRFGAFGKAEWRRHDYLWGRLDGAAHLVRLLAREADEDRIRIAQQAVLDEENATADSLSAGLADVAALAESPHGAKATIDAIRATAAGRRAVEDTVTDALRMLRDTASGIPAAVPLAGGWLSAVLARSWPPGPPPAALWKLPIRAVTAVWPRPRFWRWIRGDT
jgi:predicted acylesterase/phospholipase RssA